MYRECIGFHLNYVGNHAKIKPTHKKINGIWYPAISEDFAPNSTVFDYFPRHELVATYQLCYFLCEKNTNKKKSSDDEFIVVRDSHEFLYKVLDYSFISIDQVRKKIFFDGIYLEDEKGDISRVFYIYLQENIIIQFNFRLNIENEKWYADYPIGQSESNNFVESFLLEDGLNNTSIFQFRNNKYLLGNAFSNLKPLGLIDWSADYAFHEKALNYLSKISKENMDDFQLPSVSKIKDITSFLQANDIFPDTSIGYLNKEQYLARIIENTTHTNFIFKAYKTLYEKLLKTSNYEKFIKEQVELSVKERSDVILREKVEEVEKKHKELLDNLEKQISEKERENELLSLINEDLKKNKKALEISVSDLKTLMSKFINEVGKISSSERHVIEKLNHFLTERGVLQNKSLLPSILPPWSCVETKTDVKVIVESDTIELFRQLASTYGYDDRNVIVFDRLIRTGHLILLINQDAHIFIEHYSRLICGGRISHIALDASYIGVDDLWRNPGTNLNTGFAYAWNNAINNPEHYYVVHLTGTVEVNYVGFFKQLDEVLSYSQRPKNLLVLASLNTDVTILDDRQQQLLKNLIQFITPLKFSASEIDSKSVSQGLDTTKYSEILYTEDNKRFIQIINTPIKTHHQLTQFERLLRLPKFPEHLFMRKDTMFVCNEQLEAIKMIEGL